MHIKQIFTALTLSTFTMIAMASPAHTNAKPQTMQSQKKAQKQTQKTKQQHKAKQASKKQTQKTKQQKSR